MVITVRIFWSFLHLDSASVSAVVLQYCTGYFNVVVGDVDGLVLVNGL